MKLAWGSVPDWIAVVLALFALGLGSAVRWRKRIVQWWRRQSETAKTAEAKTEANQLAVLRDQVLEVAAESGQVLAASSTGSGNPLTVTFSDGQQTSYYRDVQAYTNAMKSGRVNPMRTMFLKLGQVAPAPVSGWDRARCEAWLAEHTDWSGG